MARLCDKLSDVISGETLGVNLIIDDPAGNSYLQVCMLRGDITLLRLAFDFGLLFLVCFLTVDVVDRSIIVLILPDTQLVTGK